MQKKLLVVAVLATLSGVASAQVTITGLAKASVEHASRKDTNAVFRVTDESSRIIFGLTEDLGAGLKAVGQFDLRVSLDTGGLNSPLPPPGLTTSSVNLGNSFVGVHSASLGRVSMGRYDLHYGTAGKYMDVAGTAPLTAAVGAGLMSQVGAGQGARPYTVAIGSRSANVVRYESPVMSGFKLTAAWSSDYSNAGETGGGQTDAKGADGTTLTAPSYTPGAAAKGATPIPPAVPTAATPATAPVAATLGTPGYAVPGNSTAGGSAYNLTLGYEIIGPLGAPLGGVDGSFWLAKAENRINEIRTLAVDAFSGPFDEKGLSLSAGYTVMDGLKIGVGFNQSTLTEVGKSPKEVKRTAFGGGVNYTIGTSIMVLANFAMAQDATFSGGGDKEKVTKTGAKLIVIGAEYAFSPRTAVGAFFSRVSNGENANYGLFVRDPAPSANSKEGAFAPRGSGIGDAPTTMSVTVKHSF